MRLPLPLFALPLAAALPLGAQVPATMPPIDSGAVIRAWMGNAQVRGRLLQPLRPGADSVRYCRFPGPPCDIDPDPGQLGWLRPEQLEHLDRQIGTRARRGAWIGGVSGLVFAFVGASLAGAFCEYDCDSGRETAFKMGVVVASSASLGALIGSAFPKMERVF